MNSKNIVFFVVTLLMMHSVCATPYYSIRSQGVNTVREMVGWEDRINRCDKKCFYGAFYAAGDLMRSFNPGRIAQCLFGPDLINQSTLTISGSRASARGANDWLADYFGLPTDFVSTVTFTPHINNFVADLGFYLGINDVAQGFYMRLHFPITHTRWNLRVTEKVTTPGINGYTAGYFSSLAINRGNLLSEATDFFSGSVPTIPADTVNSINVTFNPLKASKWATDGCGGDCRTMDSTRLADIEAIVGYNIICCDDYYLGFNIRTEAPTGNAPTGEFLFEPIVGNGAHWTLGAGISSRYIVWRNECDSSLGFYLDANFTHLFNALQRRSFDLCGKPNSRYMLAERLWIPTQGLAGCGTVPDVTVCASPTLSLYQFNNQFTPVANLTITNVRVSAALQTDIALKCEFAHPCGFTIDLGYNFWSRSRENICCIPGCELAQLDGKLWALKGDALVYGFSGTTPVALAASESKATIHNGTNIFGPGDDTTATNSVAITNPTVDNAQVAVSTTLATIVTATPSGTNQTHTSIQAQGISLANVDYRGTRGMSHTLFAHINYTWEHCKDRATFFGIGASGEFGQSGCQTLSCYRCTLSQWSVWLKGGVAFH